MEYTTIVNDSEPGCFGTHTTTYYDAEGRVVSMADGQGPRKSVPENDGADEPIIVDLKRDAGLS
jgi:hypothetical protein